MKTIVAIGAGLVALLLVVMIAGWWADSPSAFRASSSSSQIYIHGTPVCVFRQGDSIVARVGECDDGTAPESGDPGDGAPDGGGSGMVLPPGHPPVSPDTPMDPPDGGGRRLLI